MDGHLVMDRSEIMHRIRGRDTLPERIIFEVLDEVGIEHRRHAKDLPGTPEVAIDGSKVAVFVYGCFWHGCPDHYRPLKTRPGFWAQRLARMQRRDQAAARMLGAMDWKVLVIWEHELKDLKGVRKRLECAAKRKPVLGSDNLVNRVERLKLS